MQCLYCDSQIDPYPPNGICPNCGAKLRPDDTPAWQSAPTPLRSAAPVQPYYVPLQPGINCCSRCHSTQLSVRNRGFGWVAGIVGFCFLPPFGLLFGLIGRKKQIRTCRSCGHKW